MTRTKAAEEIEVTASGILASLGIDEGDAELQFYVWTETCGAKGGKVIGLEPPEGHEADSGDLFWVTPRGAARFLALAKAEDDLTLRHQRYGFGCRAAKNVLREASLMPEDEVGAVLDRR